MADYLTATEKDCKEMMEKVGVNKLADLYSDVPFEMRLRTLDIPSGKSQQEVMEEMTALAEKNVVFKTIMRGAGAYSHYIPSIVKQLAARGEFLTAYTPYQAEMSQGVLQNIFEFQTMICNLTGMDVANASVYDGSSAAAEAAFMCVDKNKRRVLVAQSIKPQTLAVMKTYLERRNIIVEVLPTTNGKIDASALSTKLPDDAACIYIETPNYNGLIEDAESVSEIAHNKNIKVIMGCNPLSLGILKSPRELGADIAVGDAQPFGLSLSFGGPYLGYMATLETKETLRKMPGRIVGETVDDRGNRAFVLTLQGREQHIRREKALSNICSNQAHCALIAAMYLTAMGKTGLGEVALACTSLAHYAADAFVKTEKAQLKYSGEFFHEFVTVTKAKASKILQKCEAEGILGGLELDKNEILWCMTETVSKDAIDTVAEIIRRA